MKKRADLSRKNVHDRSFSLDDKQSSSSSSRFKKQRDIKRKQSSENKQQPCQQYYGQKSSSLQERNIQMRDTIRKYQNKIRDLNKQLSKKDQKNRKLVRVLKDLGPRIKGYSDEELKIQLGKIQRFILGNSAESEKELPNIEQKQIQNQKIQSSEKEKKHKKSKNYLVKINYSQSDTQWQSLSSGILTNKQAKSIIQSQNTQKIKQIFQQMYKKNEDLTAEFNNICFTLDQRQSQIIRVVREKQQLQLYIQQVINENQQLKKTVNSKNQHNQVLKEENDKLNTKIKNLSSETSLNLNIDQQKSEMKIPQGRSYYQSPTYVSRRSLAKQKQVLGSQQRKQFDRKSNKEISKSQFNQEKSENIKTATQISGKDIGI